MNILSEQQARARQLSLPHDGLLTDVSREFVTALQVNGTLPNTISKRSPARGSRPIMFFA